MAGAYRPGSVSKSYANAERRRGEVCVVKDFTKKTRAVCRLSGFAKERAKRGPSPIPGLRIGDGGFLSFSAQRLRSVSYVD